MSQTLEIPDTLYTSERSGGGENRVRVYSHHVQAREALTGNRLPWLAGGRVPF